MSEALYEQHGGRVPRFHRLAAIHYERRSPRLLDIDNFIGGTKFITDALVAVGLIPDDTPAVVGKIEVSQRTGKARTVVTLIPEPIATDTGSE